MTSPSQEEPLVIDGFKVHAKSDCVPPCPFHAPSDHPLKDAPMHIREDKSYLVERICPHGIGHDDPDSVAYMHKIGESWAGTHGCDGCCTGDYPIKPVPNEPSDERAYVDKCTCGHFRGDHTPMMDDDSDSCWGCHCKKFNLEPSDSPKPISGTYDLPRPSVKVPNQLMDNLKTSGSTVSAIGDELEHAAQRQDDIEQVFELVEGFHRNQYVSSPKRPQISPKEAIARIRRLIEEQTKLAHTRQHQYTAYNPYVDTFQYWCDCLNAIDKPKSTVIERPVRFILDDDGNVVFLEIKNLHGEASIKERSEDG